MTTREVLTLQVGPYSNYIGAHFWNIQDKDLVYEPRPVLPPSNPCVLFREGLSLNKEVTFTPRLISIDLKGALGSLPRYGELYTVEEDEDTQLWEGNVRKENRGDHNDEKDIDETEPKVSKPSYEFWSDYLIPRLHPRSNLVIEEYQKDNTLKTFDIFGLGTQPDENEEQNVFESIRFFAEETDQMSGFHFLSDADSGFGGLSLRIKDHLLDEYPRKSILSFPVWPSLYNDHSPELPVNPLRNPSRFLNIALSLYHLHESSLISPLSLNPGYFPLPRSPIDIPGLDIDHQSLHQSSAPLASSLDTISLPWRLKNNSSSTYEFVEGLSQRGRKFCTMSTAMATSGESDFFSLTPGFKYSSESKIRIQSVVQRGPPISTFNLEEYLQKAFPKAFNTHKIIQDEGSPMGHPYPRLMSTPMERVGMVTSWSSADAMESILNDIAKQVGKLNLNKMNGFLEAGLESDELDELVNGFMNIADDYTDRHDI
uniref:Misato homolog 1 n=1 Tax=Caligus clemensi TaxID=344056 RepID=C1C113_CALCM|nr:misato homolog 1 [Caligus clemensi]